MNNTIGALKPCPFCGGVAECHETERHNASGFIYSVTCGNRCFGNAYSLDCEFHTRAGAIAAWNTRAPTKDLEEKIERVINIPKYGKPGLEIVFFMDILAAIKEGGAHE